MADGRALARNDLQAVLDDARFTPEDLDAIYGVDRGTVRGWGSGSVPIPEKFEKEIAFSRRVAEYERRIEALHLPVCPEETALEAVCRPHVHAPLNSLDDAARASTRAWLEHRERCTQCRENQGRIDREAGANPFFEGLWGRHARQSLAFARWSSRPWTLALTLPIAGGAVYAWWTRLLGNDVVTGKLLAIVAVSIGGLALNALRELWHRRSYG